MGLSGLLIGLCCHIGWHWKPQAVRKVCTWPHLQACSRSKSAVTSRGALGGSRVVVAPHFPFRRTIPFLLLYFRLALCCYSLANHNHLTKRLRAPLMAFCPDNLQFSRSFHFPHDQPHRTACSTHFWAAMSDAAWVTYDTGGPYVPLCPSQSQCVLTLPT